MLSASGNSAVAIDTRITPELAAEGAAREVVRRLQTMRRAAGFDIADHIITYYDGDTYLKEVITGFAGYIRQETLSDQLAENVPEEGVFSESYKLGENTLTLGVKKLS